MNSTQKYKVLLVTRETQGDRKNDFCHAQEGELVAQPFMCDNDHHPDGTCGCHRSMNGIVSGCGTTTIRVGEFDGTLEELRTQYATYFRRLGGPPDEDPKERERFVRKMVKLRLGIMSEDTDAYPVGTILEKRGYDFEVRRLPKDEPTSASS